MLTHLLAMSHVDVEDRVAVPPWLQAHPRPGIYLRQVNLPGVDSKFMEAHRGVPSD